MTRKEHLEFCKKCLNRKFDIKTGIICNLTGMAADFEGSCVNYQHDETVRETANENEEFVNEETIKQFDEKMINKLKVHQHFSYAIAGGLLATLISALIWAVATVSTQFQIGYMAIGVGLLVGFSIRFFGAGLDSKFGYLGAILSLLGCLMGNLFSQVGFYAQEQALGYFETLSYLNFEIIINVLVESFSPIDLLFYGIAVYEGYKFAFRKLSVSELNMLKSENYDGHPAGYRLRMPLVIVSLAVIGFFFLNISKGANGFKTFKYQSGKKMSEGEMLGGKEHGKWTYWFENGNTQSIGFYNNGMPDSSWQWFTESGNLLREGNYKKGLEHGVWMNYYASGARTDSGSYFEGRMNGEWKFWFEKGDLYQIGHFKRNLQEGIWKTYYENGQISNEGKMKEGSPIGKWSNYYENGKLESIITYLPDNIISIENAWDKNGKQVVINGNGLYKSYSITGQLMLMGNVENGKKTGKWQTYFENGDLKEEGSYDNEIYLLANSWNKNGEQIVKDGYGTYETYYPESQNIIETGKIENGLREGLWKLNYQTTGTVFQESNYVKGKLNGIQKVYFESGQLYSSGEMINGLREGEWNWYNENGTISSSVSFIKDKKDGIQTMYSEIGAKTKEEIYKNGELVEEKLFTNE